MSTAHIVPDHNHEEHLDHNHEEHLVCDLEDRVAAWLVEVEADSIVTFESKGLDALQLFSTEQLRALVWVGLLDEGWSRLFWELQRRGEEL